MTEFAQNLVTYSLNCQIYKHSVPTKVLIMLHGITCYGTVWESLI